MPWSGDVSRQIWSEKNLEAYKEELKSRDPTNVEFRGFPSFGQQHISCSLSILLGRLSKISK